MDLRHLRYFACVADEMHFGRAAKRLGISQPPLSQQIRGLEDELGVQLFDRTSRRVRLTEAGQLFLPEALATIAQAERAVDTARRVRAGEVGRLSVSFTTSAPFVPEIAGALYTFRHRNRDVELTLAELGRDEQITGVDQGHIDIGIVRGFEPPALPAGMESRCVLTEDMILTMRSDHRLAAMKTPIKLSALAGEPFVIYDAAIGAGFNEHFIAMCVEAGFNLRISQEASSLATLLGLVSAGFGLTVIARSLTRLHPEELVYRLIDDPRFVSRLWLIHRHAPSPTARAFLDCIAG